MDIEKLINDLNNDPDDVIEFLEQITDENIQELKDRNCTAELINLKAMIQDILTMLQTTASGGHLVDVSRMQQMLNLAMTIE